MIVASRQRGVLVAVSGGVRGRAGGAAAAAPGNQPSAITAG